MAVANILPNELSLLDNVAYNVRFLMMHPRFPGEGNTLTTKNVNSFSHYVIAETGKTSGFVIKDIGFYHYVQAIRGVPALGIQGQINIIEPYGMSLYERIVLGADSLGIENHSSAKYVLQITFKGYTHDGSQTIVPYEWLIPTTLERISSTITEQGSDYTIKFIGRNQASNMSSAKSSNETITVFASKFGEFLEKFTNAINAEQRELVKTESQLEADTYEYIISPEWKIYTNAAGNPHTDRIGNSVDIADFDLGALFEDNQSSVRQSEVVPELEMPTVPQPNQIKITMSLGTNYNDHVMAVFMNTRQIQKLVKSDSWDNQYNKWIMKFENDWNDTRFDLIRNSYAKDYKTTLHQHYEVGSIKDGIEYNKKRSNKEATQEKVDLLTTYGLLRKAYYYIYTGLNTEVLNFNFGFDSLYYVATELYSHRTLGEQRVGAGDSTYDTDYAKTVEGGAPYEAGTPLDDKIAYMKWKDAHRQFMLDNTIGGSQYKNNLLENIPLTRSDDGPFGNPKFVPEIIASDFVKSGGGLPDQKEARRVIANLMSGDNFELTMTIKGDPYWLGEVTGASNTGALANYEKGGNYLYIEFRVPDRISDHSGQMELSTVNTISGLYRVTRVDSNFSDGQFIQTLTGYLDITFALSQVRKNIPDPGGSMRK